MATKMADKMYGNSPKLERNEDGDMAIKKKDKEMDKDKTGEAEDQGSGETIPMASRHGMERADMHHKHMREHHTHDMGKHGSKKEMHGRHEEEIASMHKKHEREAGKE